MAPMLSHTAPCRPAGAASFGMARLDEWAPSCDHVAQVVIGFDKRRQTAPAKLVLGEAGQQAGVDRIGFGPDATTGTEGDDLVGMHAREPKPGLHERLPTSTLRSVRSSPPVGSNATKPTWSGLNCPPQAASAAGAFSPRTTVPGWLEMATSIQSVDPVLGHGGADEQLV